MFVHLAKDYMKKLDEVDSRLETSMEKEEIQTLGLKLRFYYNEIKHYRQLMSGVFDRIREIQEKYGFLSEDGEEGGGSEAVETPEAVRAEIGSGDEPEEPAQSQEGAPAAGAKSREQLVGLVTDWIRQLDSQGINVEDILLKPKLDEILETDAEAAGDEAATGEAPPPPEEAPEGEEPASDAAEGSIEEKEGSTHWPETHEEIDLEEMAAGADELSRLEAGPSDAEPGPEEAPETGGEPGPLIERLAEWESAIGDGEMDRVIDGVKEYVQKHRQECLGFVASDSALVVGRADSSARTDFLYGLVAMLLGNYGGAINMFEAAARKTGAPPETSRILAECYFQKGLYENALVNYRKSVSSGVQTEESALEALECLLRLEKYEEVIDTLKDEEFSERFHRLHGGIRWAEALLGLGRYDEAVEKARLLLEECEGPTERSFCYHLLARAKEAKADLVSAIDLYDRSLENDAMNAPARLALGKLCMNNNALPLAKNHFSFIARNFPESEWADEARLLLYNMAEMAAQQGDSEAAAQT